MKTRHSEKMNYRASRVLRKLPAISTVVMLSACTVTPKPFTAQELDRKAVLNLEEVTANQEPVTGPIGLYEAVARALKYNLDKRVEMMQESLRHRELDVGHYNMMPDLVASLGYDGRNNDSGARSRSLISGRESLEPSTSSERNTVRSDLVLSWDILDFGLSYVRAKQASDEALIAQERKRKVINRIVEDVRTAFWRAASSQRLLSELQDLGSLIDETLEDSRKIYTYRTTSPLKALTYQRELLEMRREIQRLHRELKLSKMQLAALMNLKPGVDFELQLPVRTSESFGPVLEREKLIKSALRNRPELREVAYRRRINDQQAEAAYLETLPSLKAFLGLHYDSNDYLYKEDWVGWGAKASWNLLKVFSLRDRRAVVQAQDALLEKRTLALTMAVMTQVEVSVARYKHVQQELKTAQEYHQTQSHILAQIRGNFESGRISDQTLIRERMNTILSAVKFDIAYADMQNAYANIYASIGQDPYASDLHGDEPVAVMARSLSEVWARRTPVGAM